MFDCDRINNHRCSPQIDMMACFRYHQFYGFDTFILHFDVIKAVCSGMPCFDLVVHCCLLCFMAPIELLHFLSSTPTHRPCNFANPLCYVKQMSTRPAHSSDFLSKKDPQWKQSGHNPKDVNHIKNNKKTRRSQEDYSKQ